MITLDDAVLAACPAPTFDALVNGVRAAIPDAEAAEIDEAARRLGVEQGEARQHSYT